MAANCLEIIVSFGNAAHVTALAMNTPYFSAYVETLYTVLLSLKKKLS